MSATNASINRFNVEKRLVSIKKCAPKPAAISVGNWLSVSQQQVCHRYYSGNSQKVKLLRCIPVSRAVMQNKATYWKVQTMQNKFHAASSKQVFCDFAQSIQALDREQTPTENSVYKTYQRLTNVGAAIWQVLNVDKWSSVKYHGITLQMWSLQRK